MIGLPHDATLRAHLESLSGPLLHTLVVSGPWDSTNVGGEEVDIDWLLEGSQAGEPAAPEATWSPSSTRCGASHSSVASFSLAGSLSAPFAMTTGALRRLPAASNSYLRVCTMEECRYKLWGMTVAPRIPMAM